MRKQPLTKSILGYNFNLMEKKGGRKEGKGIIQCCQLTYYLAENTKIKVLFWYLTQ